MIARPSPMMRAVRVFMAGFVIVSLCRTVFIVSGGDERLVTFVPDDAFYYLVPARNFGILGRWTFDGVSTSTGFHLLYAYFLAAIYAIFPAIPLNILFVSVTLLNTALIAGSIWLIAAALDNYSQPPVMIVALSVVLFTFLSLTNILMESCIELFLAALLFYLVFSKSAVSATRREILFAFAAGCLGSLVRSDFGLMASALCAATVIEHMRTSAAGGQFYRAGAGLLGACCGLIIVFIHSYWIDGKFFQTSIAIKRHWGTVEGYSILRPLREFMNVPAPYMVIPVHTFALKLTLLMATACTIAYLAYRRFRNDGGKTLFDPVLVFAVLSIVGYTVIYGFDSGAIQSWYSTSILIPTIAIMCTLGLVFRRVDNRIAYTMAALFAASGVALSLLPPSPWQIYTYWGGLFLRQHEELKPAGAWNAGVVGYFAGSGVINLDGLMNDDVYPYIIDGRLAEYVTRRGIHSIVDHEDMLSNPLFRRRGGYTDGELDRMLEPLKTFTGPDIDPPYRLWRVVTQRGEGVR